MKSIVKTLILILLFSCTSNNNQVPIEKSEPGLFSKDTKKGLSITDFLNKDKLDDKSFYILFKIKSYIFNSFQILDYIFFC